MFFHWVVLQYYYHLLGLYNTDKELSCMVTGNHWQINKMEVTNKVPSLYNCTVSSEEVLFSIRITTKAFNINLF